jgi:Arc/MetJ-type ribon-helix-helix transcriptional regulator
MLMTFRCPPHLKERIDALIREGLYPDFSAFVLAALQNQLVLEEAQTPGAAAAAPAETGSDSAPPPAPHNVPVETGPSHPFEGEAERQESGPQDVPIDLGLAARPSREARPKARPLPYRPPPAPSIAPLPDVLRLDRLSPEPPIRLPAVAPDLLPPGEVVPINRWLFGQYNRLLPAKVSLRALAVLVSEARDAVPLREAASRTAEAAADFGSHLRALDARLDLHRDEALATAFPDEGPLGQKGRLRYQNHFVGHVVKGEAGGLPADLKLARIETRKGRPYILPTAPGWAFARLSNPLLDGHTDEDGPARFGAEETAFLLQHVREKVPAEVFAYRVVLTLIRRGERTPDEVTAGLAPYLPPGWTVAAQKDFIATQRTGAIARAADLGLILRQREARRISYQVTPEGDRFLDLVGEAPAGTRKKGSRRTDNK